MRSVTHPLTLFLSVRRPELGFFFWPSLCEHLRCELLIDVCLCEVLLASKCLGLLEVLIDAHVTFHLTV